MLEAIIIIAVVLAVAIAIVLILAATRPDTFRIERSGIINAPADRIFAVLSDFRQWAAGRRGSTRIPT